LLQVGDILKRGNISCEQSAMTFKQLRLPIVDAGSVKPYRLNLPGLSQPPRRFRSETGEVQVRDHRGATLVSSEILFSIGVKFSEASSQQDYAVHRYGAVSSFPIFEVAFRHQVIRISSTLPRDIDHDALTHQLHQRNFIDGVLSFREMHWRIDMGAAMFRS